MKGYLCSNDLVLIIVFLKKKLNQHHSRGTIIPIIILSDKTQVTMFHNKAAYPIYLTIGNILKEIYHKPSHSAHILLAHLPITRFKHISNKASRYRTMVNLYHACMSCMLVPLESVGLDRVKMCSGDGALHYCHSLFACFIGDCPEQLLATGMNTSNAMWMPMRQGIIQHLFTYKICTLC